MLGAFRVAVGFGEELGLERCARCRSGRRAVEAASPFLVRTDAAGEGGIVLVG